MEISGRWRRTVGFTGTGAALAMAVLLLSLPGCRGRVHTGPLQTDSTSVEVGAAQSVEARINMRVGNLSIRGGSERLLDAEFRYNVPDWKPSVAYQVAGGQGTLAVEQSGAKTLSATGNVRNEWDLKLSNTVPLDLAVDLGAGRGTLALGHLAIGRLDINAGAGEVTIDLTGAPSLTKLGLKIGAGSAKLDLTGEWKKDLDAKIVGGIGKATIRLPSDVGVRVTIERGFGSVNSGSLVRDGDAYINEAFGSSPVTLFIKIETGIGEINLEEG